MSNAVPYTLNEFIQKPIYSQIIKGSELFFMIGNSIDSSEFRIQRCIFEFLD